MTNKPTVVTQAIVDLLKLHAGDLGIKGGVWYGDQSTIAKTPALCVETGTMEAPLAGAPYRTQNTFNIFILIYHSKVQDQQVTRKEADELAEAVMDLLHDNVNDLGVIHGHITMMESGYTVRSATLLRSTRLTWTGLSKVNIASP